MYLKRYIAFFGHPIDRSG